MAKPLREPSPSSSIARLLDIDAATRATSAVDPHALSPDTNRSRDGSHLKPASKGTAPLDAPALIKREFILDSTADAALNRLIDLLRSSTGARLSGSHVVRAILHGVAVCTESLRHEAAAIGHLKLPSNARGREHERRRFEETIAAAIVNGIRGAAAYRTAGDD